MLPRRIDDCQGFTLVEVLVALLIMAVLATLGWRGIDSMARTREVAQAASERTLRLAAIVSQFEQDVQAVQAVDVVPSLAFDGNALRLVRRTDAGMQVVVWSLLEGRWRRWASAGTGRAGELQQAWLASQQLLGNEPQQIPLLEGASGWQVYFYRDNAWTNAQSSGDLATAVADQAAAAAAAAAAQGGGGTAGTPPAGTPPAGTPPAGTPAPRREKLPTGVRLQIELPEGKLTRDVALGPQLP
ncbi:MAG: prepilin-type N-terminal cleavage/methylation domain-containing protein [Burkholderiales bacterium]|nr:prepilin-type N-terminal cleavage/methylation domain-containing protein [Burkholderiales bacterium]